MSTELGGIVRFLKYEGQEELSEIVKSAAEGYANSYTAMHHFAGRVQELEDQVQKLSLFERAIKLLVENCEMMHYDEIEELARAVLAGETRQLELGGLEAKPYKPTETEGR